MNFRARHFHRESSGFTLVEIAISLAVIGIALVGIIGVLPLGMSVQRDNREQTVINQDATVFIEAIRNGSSGLDDLTNYVYAITNIVTEFDTSGKIIMVTNNSYNYSGSAVFLPFVPSGPVPINSGLAIVGLLSMPEYVSLDGHTPTTNVFGGGFSNHVFAYVRSMSGPAVEKPPQDNPIIHGDQNNPLGDAFGYRILCVNAPVANTNLNVPQLPPAYDRQLEANLHELRLTFQWPVLPNGGIGTGRQTYRTLVAGQIAQTNYLRLNQWLYFYQPQSFTNAP
jgi:prepilin-type N-terminal cleavage/methylation domain-containing protein